MEIMRVAQLLRLSSPGLPIGGFSYSQGLESAIDTGIVHDAATAFAWIRSVLLSTQARFEGAAVARAYRFLEGRQDRQLRDLNVRLLTSRETVAQRGETTQMAYSLLNLLAAVPEGSRHEFPPDIGDEVALPLAWAHAARCFGIDCRAALTGWMFSWAENQLLVLMKTLPMGHGAAQRLLSDILPMLPEAVMVADALPFDEMSAFAPRLSVALMQHQHQYSRLFRT